MNKFSSLRKEAAIHFVECDMSGESSGESVRRISPIGKVRDHGTPEEYENELGWTLTKPKDNDFKGIILSSDKPTVEGLKDRFQDFVIEDFELDSPHAWKRMF